MAEHISPCAALIDVKEKVEELNAKVNQHTKELASGAVKFAVINTKLNIILGVLTTVGIALCGVLVKYLFAFGS